MYSRKVYALLLLIVFSFVFSGSLVGVAAQEAQSTPTPESTIEATQVVIPPVATIAPTPDVVVTPPAPEPAQPSDRLIVIIGLFAVTVYMLLDAVLKHKGLQQVNATLIKFMDDKRVQDEARQAYMESSVQVQQAIKFAESLFKLAGSLDIVGIDPVLDKAGQTLEQVTSTASVN